MERTTTWLREQWASVHLAARALSAWTSRQTLVATVATVMVALVIGLAPLPPYLAATALVLSLLAVIWRLRGQVSCPLPAPRRQAVRA